jgi:hypothetical protein
VRVAVRAGEAVEVCSISSDTAEIGATSGIAPVISSRNGQKSRHKRRYLARDETEVLLSRRKVRSQRSYASCGRRSSVSYLIAVSRQSDSPARYERTRASRVEDLGERQCVPHDADSVRHHSPVPATRSLLLTRRSTLPTNRSLLPPSSSTCRPSGSSSTASRSPDNASRSADGTSSRARDERVLRERASSWRTFTRRASLPSASRSAAAIRSRCVERECAA